MKITVIYYSTYGHIVSMAQLMKEVVDKSGVVSQADIFQVPEMQSGNVLEMIHAPPKVD